MRGVHQKVHEIHFACLCRTNTVQLAYCDSDRMRNAAGCSLGVGVQLFLQLVGKKKRLAGALQLLLMVQTSRSPQGLLLGQAYEKRFTYRQFSLNWLNHHLSNCPNMGKTQNSGV